MDFDKVMTTLERMGTAQNVKIYTRHGMGENLFGVSFANLGLLKKQIKVDHELALKLWNSGIGDARNLATMIADPAKFTAQELDDWVKDQESYGICDLLSGLVGKTTFAQEKAEKWSKSGDEWIGRTGWNLIGVLALDVAVKLPDSYFAAHVELIEQTIHSRKNFTRHAMNMALISIGMRSPMLKKIAQAAAKRIGKVEVDHGETSCKTPDAHSYIEKAFAHHQGKLEKAAAKAKPAAQRAVKAVSAATRSVREKVKPAATTRRKVKA